MDKILIKDRILVPFRPHVIDNVYTFTCLRTLEILDSLTYKNNSYAVISINGIRVSFRDDLVLNARKKQIKL